MSLAFLLTSLVIVATPGTGVLYTLAAGLSRGARASVLAAFACTLGIVPHLAAAITGLAALLHTSAVAFQTLKYLGVAYLLYLAWQTWHDKDALVVDEDDAPVSARTVIVTGVLINILNPKLTMFFFAFLPQFVDPAATHQWLPMLELSAVFMAMTFVVFAVYGVFAASVRTHVIARPRIVTWLRRSFAACFVGAGRPAGACVSLGAGQALMPTSSRVRSRRSRSGAPVAMTPSTAHRTIVGAHRTAKTSGVIGLRTSRRSAQATAAGTRSSASRASRPIAASSGPDSVHSCSARIRPAASTRCVRSGTSRIVLAATATASRTSVRSSPRRPTTAVTYGVSCRRPASLV